MPALSDDTKTLTRDIEEVIVKGSSIPGWVGQEIDRIHLYKWNGTGFEAIPFQIDHVNSIRLDQNCSWYDWQAVQLCEKNFKFDLNGNENLETGLLTNPDEIVFLARDSGSRAPNTTTWVAGNVSTVRYEIEVQDKLANPPNTGWVYAFLWLEEHAFETPYPYYVNWSPGTGNASPARDEDSTCDVNPLDPNTRKSKTCGFFRGRSEVLPDKETCSLNFKGNWIINRLQLKPPSGNLTDLYDRGKNRGTGSGNTETELNWSTLVCGLHEGDKTGRVRTIYVGQGTESGAASTITYMLYPTHMREVMRVRLHNNVTNVQSFFDYLAPPQGGTASEIYVASKTGLADSIDGASPSASFGQANEPWTEVNTVYGRIIEFFRETRPMPVPQSYYYEDAAAQSRTPEFQSGAYGNHGQQWKDATPWMQDLVCNQLNPNDPLLKFAQLERTIFFKAGGLGAPGADDAAKYLTWMNTPLETVLRQQLYTIPISPPGGGIVCPPTVDALSGNNGRWADITPHLISGCTETGTVTGFKLYRAVGLGQFNVLARLASGESFRDWAVYRGQTYRYYARAFNPDGVEGPTSSTYSVLITDTELPDAPLSVTAAALNQAVTLTWVNPKSWDIRGFNVYVGTAPGGPYLKANSTLITGVDTYTVQGLVNNTTYYMVARSKDWGDNESANSAEVSAVPHP